MNEQDLRVIKTRANIESALIELLRSKPIEKISVAELARTAKINKGTFYLHYLDIKDLYMKLMRKTVQAPFENAAFFPDFFDAPDRFMEELDRAIMANLPNMNVFFRDQTDSALFSEVTRRLCDKVYETGRIERSVENDMKLDAVFGALLSYMPKYYASHWEAANALTVSLIRLFFPANAEPSEG